MSTFDAALGLDHTTLDTAVAQLYAKPAAREQIFKGSQSGEEGSIHYTVSWDVKAPPTFKLEPPTAQQWAGSIDKTGKAPPADQLPTANAFQLDLPSFYAEYALGAAHVSGTGHVAVFATAASSGKSITITPLSVWVDESQWKLWDKFIINHVIIPMVLDKMGQLLAGFHLPALSFSSSAVSVELSDPVTAITGGLLISASCLKSGGPVDLTGATWPVKPLFALFSSTLLAQVAQQVAAAKIVKQYTEDGKYAGGLMTWDYTADVKTVTVSFHSDDMTKADATIGFTATAELKPLGIGGPCAISSAASSL
jgi:hypothetical protein